ncbi:MAG: hypothetical protein EOO39_38835, partial [Cytophagaceae bacterium]
FPVILGHEGSGVIESIGEDVHHLSVGDHVVLTYGYCGECEICRSGTPAYCYEFFPRNFSGARVDGTHNHHYLDGKVINDNFFSQSSFATYAIAHKNNVIAVPKDAPLEILGPLGCGIQTGAGAVINSLKVKIGSSIVITGTGAVGLAALMAAKASSATVIIAVDINEERLNFSKELGATHTINSLTEDVQKRITAKVARQLQNPEVIVSLTRRADKTASILGAVKNTGKFVLQPDWRLLDLLAESGGITATRPEWATAVLVRSSGETFPVDLLRLITIAGSKDNVPVKAGDILIVREVDQAQTQVQVLGEVAKPGVLPIPSDGSIAAAIAAAGGPTPLSALSKAAILRGGETIPVNLQSLMQGGKLAGDIKLQPGDTLVIPANRQTFVVLGAVTKPGALCYPEEKQLDVLSALALAGGQTPSAD